LQRIGSLTTTATVLVVLGALAALLSIWASVAAEDPARELLAGDIDADTFIERTAPYLLMSVVQGVLTLTGAVVVIIWMYRIAKNHRTLHRGGTWGPGWAIGGWFLPPLLYVIPTLMLRELWKASDPDVPVGGDWRSVRVSPLIPLWFVLYSIVPIVLLVAQSSTGLSSFGASEEDLAEQIIDGRTMTFVASLLTVAAAVVFLAIVRGLSRRHQALTGESVAE
ncbi:MAG: DUF4328 domain-containing protein, partial [Ilumatobacter sp.]|nr:DUF4328 domain-containing protein [Ilumatobacter sp.]